VQLQLTLSLADEGTDCRVTLEREGAAAPLAEERVALPDMARLEARCLLPLREYLEHPVSRSQLETLGLELAAIAFLPAVRAALLALREEREPPAAAHLRLRISHPDLVRLPWEYACLETDPGIGSSPTRIEFLGLHPCFYLIRESGAARRDIPPLSLPLRALLVWADPQSARYPALPHLSAELDCVRHALEQRAPSVMLEEVKHATPATLARALKEHSPHLLHFVGHGDALPTGSTLILQGEGERTESRLYASRLAEMLRETPLRLAILSVCRSEASGEGMARTLSESGVPAVIGTQLSLRDSVMAPFIRSLYGALLQAVPVEEALRQAREAIREAGPDWGAPLLYLNVPSGALFPPLPVSAALPRYPLRLDIPFYRDRHFVGRETLLQTLHEMLEAGEGEPTALVGMAGIGKTLLASEYAHRYRHSYPAGIFWFDAHDPAGFLQEYAAVGAACFGAPEDLPTAEAARRVQQEFQRLETPCLIVLDNVHPDADLSPLPRVGACRVLATTRVRQIESQGFRILEPPPLPEESARELLLEHMRADTPSEAQAVQEIAARLGCLPFALRLAASRIQRHHMSFQDYLALLKEDSEEALEAIRGAFHTLTRYSGGVLDSIEISCASLGSMARRMLTTAACFAARGIAREILFEACGDLSRRECRQALWELENHSLLKYDADGRLSMHDLVRTFGQLRPAQAERAAACARAAAALSRRLRDANEKMDWHEVRAEIAHCRAAAALAREYGLTEPGIALLYEMGRYLVEYGELHEARACFEDGLAGAARLWGAQHPQTVLFEQKLAETLQFLGEHAEARRRMEHALALGESLFASDPASLGELHNSMGYILKIGGALEMADAHYQRALEMMERAFGRPSAQVAMCLNNIGAAREVRGDRMTALTHYRDALQMDREVFGRAHPNIAILLNNIGRVLQSLGGWEEALACHQEALEIYVRTYGEQHKDAAMTHYFLGETFRGMAQRESAQEHYRAALETLGALYGEAYPLYRRVQERSARPWCPPDRVSS
jgi:tetratricopeptide (TPR) repeat protein